VPWLKLHPKLFINTDHILDVLFQDDADEPGEAILRLPARGVDGEPLTVKLDNEFDVAELRRVLEDLARNHPSCGPAA
jgi:hypothetical protein